MRAIAGISGGRTSGMMAYLVDPSVVLSFQNTGKDTGCFLKDERDLATALLQDETDAEWWIGVERDFAPMRRGRSSYAQVLAEAPARMEIRAALVEGRAYTVDLPAKRVKLIVAQELAARSSFSCECDAAKAEDDDMV